jgi:multiple sugar transport system ATP-binding protein
MVFQNYAIYPHMSVRKNIAFGLRASSAPRAEKEKRIDEVAAILGMTDLLDRRPSQLSGGQRQRVAIGRAMVRDPKVFLFDEPLSNLDAQLRTQMRLEIKKLHQRVGTTIVFVTHDQIEAMTLADRIVVMKDGHIRQVGTPAEVFHRPADTFVARFIGAPSMNMLDAVWLDGAARLPHGAAMSVEGRRAEEGAAVVVGLRPDDLLVTEGPGLFEGQVSVVEPLGHDALVYVGTGAGEVVAKASGRTPPMPGATVRLAATPGSVHLFDRASGRAL